MNWAFLPPTPAQERAIRSYERGYGIMLDVQSKQDAHDVISKFVPAQKLTFNMETMTVLNTNVKFAIANPKVFKEKAWDKFLDTKVKSFRITDDGKTAVFKVKGRISQKDTLNLLTAAINHLDELENNPSFSDDEDNMGFFSPDDIDDIRDMEGNNPYTPIE